MGIRIRKPRRSRNFIATEVGFWRSTPVLKLKRQLRLETACKHLAGVYILQLRELVLTEGDFDGTFEATAEDLAAHVEYEGPARAFLAALVKAGIIRAKKRQRHANVWEFAGWRDSPTGHYQAIREADRARQHERRMATKREELERQRAAAEARSSKKPREKRQSEPPAGAPEAPKKIRGQLSDIAHTHGKQSNLKQSKISPYPQTGAPDAASGGEGLALWAWFFRTYPKPDWPAKSRARFDALTADDHELIKLHLEKVVLKKPDAALGMLAYLHSCQWLQMRRKPMSKAKLATPPPPKEDQPSEAGLAEMKRSAELTAELKKQGLKGFELMQKVDQILAAERGDAPPTTTKAN